MCVSFSSVWRKPLNKSGHRSEIFSDEDAESASPTVSCSVNVGFVPQFLDIGSQIRVVDHITWQDLIFRIMICLWPVFALASVSEALPA